MPIEVNRIEATERVRYLVIGRSFGSDHTTAQGAETHKHAVANAAALKLHGFGPSKIDQLADAFAALKESGADRDVTRTGAGLATRLRHDAERSGKGARGRGHVVLANSLSDLRANNEATTALEVEQVLHQASDSGSDLQLLSGHLALLAGALDKPIVAARVAESGGPEALAAIAAARVLVDAAIARGRSNASRTPQETERLDVLDGIVVDLCRQARKAARSAAKATGTPALAALFELDLLYGTPSPKAAPTVA